jgi:hypothetical protein
LNGEVMPGGWDYQLRLPSGCGSLSADYFLKASDGTIIHVLNQGFSCGAPGTGERSYAIPRFEAPKGPHDWMTRGSFVSSIEPVLQPGANGAPPKLLAVRIRFYKSRSRDCRSALGLPRGRGRHGQTDQHRALPAFGMMAALAIRPFRGALGVSVGTDLHAR